MPPLKITRARAASQHLGQIRHPHDSVRCSRPSPQSVSYLEQNAPVPAPFARTEGPHYRHTSLVQRGARACGIADLVYHTRSNQSCILIGSLLDFQRRTKSMRGGTGFMVQLKVRELAEEKGISMAK